jgi:hypothetical protein
MKQSVLTGVLQLSVIPLEKGITQFWSNNNLPVVENNRVFLENTGFVKVGMLVNQLLERLVVLLGTTDDGISKWEIIGIDGK